MKIFLTGATGIMGRSAIHALQLFGHSVVGLARTPSRARTVAYRGAEPFVGSIFDTASLVRGMRDCQVVCNLATHVPVGVAATVPGAWRTHHKIRTIGSQMVVEAALEAGIQRIVQESVSSLYADQGDVLITEEFPVDVTNFGESAVLAQTHAAEFAQGGRNRVALRFGMIAGFDDNTRLKLKRASTGKAIGFGSRNSWCHVIHPDDVGSAIAAAIDAPDGIYNAGAAPIRCEDLHDEFAFAAGRDSARYFGPMTRRLGGEKAELVTRSQRVSSGKLTDQTGWKPAHETFSTDWLVGHG